MGKHSNEDLSRALDGMEELCSFLDVKLIFPLHVPTAPIDEALEANERKQLNSKRGNAAAITPPIARMPPVPVASSSYEMPENAFMHSSTRRLLGDRREIELSTITSDERPEQMVLQNGLPAAEPQQPQRPQ